MPIAVAEGLLRRDRQCSTTQDQNLLEADDAEQFAFCKRTGRVLITNDRDFARITAADTQHPGVVLWIGKSHYGKLIKDIDHLCMTMTAEDFQGRVFYL